MSSKRGASVSAAELMRRLNADPEFTARNHDRELAQRGVEAGLAAEERPLIKALADAGVSVSSVWDLVNADWPYASAIPVLCEHLSLPYHLKIREGIARALTVTEARGVAGSTILAELRRHNRADEFRWALANALTVAADICMLDELSDVASDPAHSDVADVLNIARENLIAGSRR